MMNEKKIAKKIAKKTSKLKQKKKPNINKKY